MLEKMSLDIVFLGVDAIDPVAGVCRTPPKNARLAQMMLRAGEKKSTACGQYENKWQRFSQLCRA